MDLRPLSLGELLDRSFSLYRARFRTLVAIMVIPAVFAAGMAMVSQTISTLAGRLGQPGHEPNVSEAFTMMGLAFAMFALMAVYFVVSMIAFGATTAAVSDIYMGRDTSAAGAFRRVRDRVGRLLLVLLLIGLRMAGVFIAAIVVGAVMAVVFALGAPWAGGVVMVLMVLAAGILMLYLWLRYALSIPAVMLEPITASEAIRRGVELGAGHRWRILIVGLFAAAVTYATALLFQGPFTVAAIVMGPDTRAAFALNLVGAFAGAVAGAISGPLGIVALALLYYDMRVRHEGLDLQLMMQSLETPGGGSTFSTPPAVTPS
ncbi:MAG: hypothetical protein A3H96_13990 [Acidobacteria bacterium RIFCSPLOWO2_02_FULL_67_36]|nr:MAG: hypothetical protein A3H96_13990 [Acidobacteria bacterium RIFCSPLOWO2_02_FULL_67_36]OFW18341.1 MAG: hypothetical protein A3G21_07500 [Acidobacteria bacterium RIFCSPLOWO2_12_FULL_66_21]